MTLQPLPLSALFAAIFLKEKMQIKQWLYFGISFAGVAFIKGFDERYFPYIYDHRYLLGYVFRHGHTCIRQLKDTEHPLV